MRVGLLTLALVILVASPVRGESVCESDEVQESGSIYRICMPPSGYNGILVVWAHGFEDAGTKVEIPEDQLCLPTFCIHDIITGLGFAFATNSYSKTGLAVREGQADILDLVNIFTESKGPPRKVYLIGASGGGLITALSVEQRPDVFSAGVATCGPVGDFSLQIAYLGHARATFQYFFPGVIPGDPFNPTAGLIASWPNYYENVVKPNVFNPANRHRLDQWVAVAGLPFDAGNYLETVEISLRDVLRYAVVNLNDVAATLRGFPFDNRFHWYTGSDNDLLLNIFVPRVSAAATAIQEMKSFYNTSGVLQRPLITLHTMRDLQVPYLHEPIYDLKTFFSGALLTRHLNIPIDRFGHCNFTLDEALFSFATMLLYDGILGEVSGTESLLTPSELTAFERRANAAGLRHRRAGAALAFKLKLQ